MHPFESIAEVEARLEELARGDAPLVRFLPARPGQKEGRYIQLLSTEAAEQPATINPVFDSPAAPAAQPVASAVEALAAEVAVLRTELEQLREEFRAFRAQF
jgi:uncharacterized protein YceH (UPF0502 family)